MPLHPSALVDALRMGLGVPVAGLTPVTGGDVATAYRVDLADGSAVFAKTHATAPPGFFTTEAAGLRWLGAAAALPVPEVLLVSDGDADAGVPNHLVLAWIAEGRARADTDAGFGRGLAALHATGAANFGREDRRTTGSRGLPNEPCDTWVACYATQRLQPLARIARDEGALPSNAIAELEAVAARLADLGGPPEPPARLHGDLWAGNRLVDEMGASWLIDPAAHGGHREFDLAMMRLFGGFGPACFHAYEEVAPLADGWRERIALHQLAPLIVHAIKFGGSYVAAATDAIRTYR